MEVEAASAEEIDLIVRYLAGRLSETESTRLEARVAAEPGLYKRVEEVLRLQEGLAVLAQRDDLDTLLREPPWRKRLGIWGAAAAALALAVIGLGFWWASRERPAGVLALSVAELHMGVRAPTIEGPYVFARMRGDASVLEIPRPSTRSAIELKLVPSVSSAGGRYRLTVESSGAGGRAHALVLDSVAFGPDGYVTVFLDSAALTPGRYDVALKPSASAGADEGERFEFQVP
jgi:hypothetical protein